jgi:2-C-methyl-D-erythritol 4-phosphate cytidylyltransferase/2-C-methyl-D-erythritol 2,4-cyclodiphosphate synthase
MIFSALIVAAGRGERAGAGDPKQFRLLRGKPVLAWSIDAFSQAGAAEIVVVTAPDQLSQAITTKQSVRVVAGGATRTASVRAGLAAVGDAEFVFIHDAARPCLRQGVIAGLIEALEQGAGGAAPALPLSDAVHRVDANGMVLSGVDREGLARVQTPQAFRTDLIRRAYAAATADQAFADDIALALSVGARVRLTPGDPLLMKLTYSEDFTMLERMMGGITCVGSGFDAHRFGPGDQVTLCGVGIAHNKGLIGHSDADAGWHALVDAILGALGKGDIGAHFPPSDPQWKGANSERFLRRAVALAAEAGARIQNVDITLICEAPRIGPYRDAMRARTAEVTGIPVERVSIKATTTERMGFTGREEGLAAQATVSIDIPWA